MTSFLEEIISILLDLLVLIDFRKKKNEKPVSSGDKSSKK